MESLIATSVTCQVGRPLTDVSAVVQPAAVAIPSGFVHIVKFLQAFRHYR